MIFGLIVILALLSPISRVTGYSLDNINIFSFYETSNLMPTLEEVLKWGEELENDNYQLALEMVKEGLYNEINVLLKEKFDKEIVDIQFKIDKGTSKEIDHITLILKPCASGLVQPVEKVDFKSSDNGEANNDIDREKIKNWLCSHLELSENQVEVIVLKQ